MITPLPRFFTRCGRASMFAIAVPLSLAAASNAQSLPESVGINEAVLRSIATKSVNPSYPAESLTRRAQGVAVVSVLIDRTGKTATVKALEAPDEAIANAVINAVQLWEFKPVQVGSGGAKHAVPAESTLTFYYRILDGKGTVTDPESLKPLSTAAAGRLIELADADFHDTFAKSPKLVVLDIRMRPEFGQGHRERAINIPYNEVVARSQELAGASAVAIDCFPELSSICTAVANDLMKSLSRDVYLVRRAR